LLVLALIVLPTMGLANGGPVSWTGETFFGGVVPDNDTGIELVSEYLRIVLDDDAQHYDVAATYILSNPGEPRTVTFGVPIVWSDELLYPEEDTGARLSAVPMESIRITLGEEPVRCAPVASFDNDAEPELEFEWVDWDGLLQRPVDAWCLAELTIPTNGALPLRLTYRGELWYVDEGFSNSALTMFGSRNLSYPLFPAGYWSGRPDHVAIRVELGPYAGLARVVSGEFCVDYGSYLGCRLDHPHLDELPNLVVELDAEPLLSHREMATWNSVGPSWGRYPVDVIASSVLEPQDGHTYSASNLTDGDPATAWCEGSEGLGVGDYVELSFRAPDPSREMMCHLQGFAIVPGYAADQRRYSTNGRPLAIEMADCSDPSVAQMFRFEDERHERWDTSATLLEQIFGGRGEAAWPLWQELMPMFWPSSPVTEACLRFTIREVAPGSRFEDTCLSELVPILNCG